MEINSDDNSDLITPKPVVLVLIDGWGIAPKYHGNVFADLKLKNFSNLVKDYPLALLDVGNLSIKDRYQKIGAAGLLSQKIYEAGLSQLNLTESEKLLTSWHYFNNGRENKLTGENLKIISSKTGNREEDAKQILPLIIKECLLDIKRGSHDFVLVNLANLDLVSATGDLEASKTAAKLLDKNLGKLVNAVLKQNGVLVLTAAYGHAEAMINMATELPQPGITNNPVPFIIVSHKYQGRTIGLPDTLDDDLSLVEPVGDLENVAPTILKILNLPLPEDFPGKSLL